MHQLLRITSSYDRRKLPRDIPAPRMGERTLSFLLRVMHFAILPGGTMHCTRSSLFLSVRVCFANNCTCRIRAQDRYEVNVLLTARYEKHIYSAFIRRWPFYFGLASSFSDRDVGGCCAGNSKCKNIKRKEKKRERNVQNGLVGT